MKRILLPTVAALSLLGACSPENPMPTRTTGRASTDIAAPTSDYLHFEGIWQGVITPAASGTSRPAIAMVNGWGEFRLVAGSMQMVGFPKRTATDVAGEITGITSAETTWSDGSRIGAFTLNGEISADNFIRARYAGSKDSGTLDLASSIADQSTEIGSVQGVWVQYDEFDNIVATLQVDVYDGWAARISGSHSNGCRYLGNTEAWTSAQSYDVVPFEVSGCPPVNGIDVNGTYSGTGALIDVEGDSSNELILVVALSNEASQITFFLHKIPG